MTETELAYIAGFTDGEGCITIVKAKHPHLRLSVVLCNAHGQVLKRVRELFGGHLYLKTQKNPKHKNSWTWTLSAAAAVPFLEAILPYLQLKIKQAEIGLAFQKTMTWHGNKPASKEILELRETQRAKIQALNRKGPPPSKTPL